MLGTADSLNVSVAAALVILGAVSAPHWKALTTAGPRSLLYMTIGGIVLLTIG